MEDIKNPYLGQALSVEESRSRLENIVTGQQPSAEKTADISENIPETKEALPVQEKAVSKESDPIVKEEKDTVSDGEVRSASDPGVHVVSNQKSNKTKDDLSEEEIEEVLKKSKVQEAILWLATFLKKQKRKGNLS